MLTLHKCQVSKYHTTVSYEEHYSGESDRK